MDDNQNPTNSPNGNGISINQNKETSAPDAGPNRFGTVLIVLGVVVVLILVIWLVVIPKKTPAPAAQPLVDKTQTQAEQASPITPVAADVVPQGLPANLPWETGAQVTQNFTAKDQSTGKTQSTRIYNSAKTLDANFALYQKYLQDNGWTVMNSLSQAVIKNLDATKAAARLDITISKDDNGQVTVSVSYVN